MHFAFAFVTVQLLSPQIYIVPSFPKPWPLVSVLSVTSRRKNSPCANASVVRGKLDLDHIFVLFNDRFNCLLLIRRAISHAGARRHAAGPSGAALDAESAAPIGSSDDSPDSYNGDDARRYLCEWNTAMDRYSKATRESGHLEIVLSAS